MRKILNRFSAEEKISISIKSIVIAIFLVGIVSSCSSIRLGFNSQPLPNQKVNPQYPVKTLSTNFETFKNLNPEDLGLNISGNWVHCRTHGFHDLNDWTDFRYSPHFCRPSLGFMQASQWNWNWGGINHWNNNLMWNNRFNQWGYTPHRWSPFGYDRWGYTNYGWGNPYLWYGSHFNNYYGWNTGYRYNSNRYNRTSTINGRRGRVINRRSTNSIRTTPTRTTPTRTNNVRPNRTIRSSETRVIKPTRTRTTIPPVRTNTIPVRTNNVRPVRTTTPIKRSTSTTNRRGSKPIGRPIK